MKRIITMLLFSVSVLYGYSQYSIDSISEAIDNHEGKLNAMEERILTDDSDLFKLT